jgi:chromate transporter
VDREGDDGTGGPAGLRPDASRGSALEVFSASLRLGLTSFGGPIAHLGYQREAFVVRRRWLDDTELADIVALCQTLPGPASSQLMIAIGRLRAGWAGALAAFLGFTLPSAIVMTLVGLWAVGTAMPETGPVAGAIAGLKVAAVAVVAHAVVSMARRLTPDLPRLTLAGVAAVALLAMPSPVTQVALIGVGALLGWAAWRVRGRGRFGAASDRAPTAGSGEGALGPLSRRVGSRRASAALLATFAIVLLGSQAVALATADPGARFTAAVTRSGALVFGGGHVVLPLLDAGVVAPGWVTSNQFLAGYGAAQAVPGPLFTFASYLGAVSVAGPGGVPGAVLATIAIFLPGALLVLATLPLLGWLRSRTDVSWSLAGVNAVVVGILAAALVTPVATAGLTSPLAVIVAVAGAAGLMSGRVPPLVVVAGSAAAMALAASV